MSTPALDALISQIVATAAKEIAAAVRAQAASPPAPRPAAAATKKPAAAEPAKPAAGKPHPRRSYTDADIEGVLALITSKPGLRSEEIKAAIGGDDRAVEKILERLRASGRVKTIGIKRSMTYTVASTDTPAAKKSGVAKTRPAAKAKKAKAAKKGRAKAAAPVSPIAAEVAASAPAALASEPAPPATGPAGTDAILAVIREHPSLRAEQIRARLGLPAAEVTAALEKLRIAKQVTTSGKARGTTYTAA